MALNTHPHHGRGTDPRLATIRTPLNLPTWAWMLRNHPDKDYVRYLLTGIEHGFQIGIAEDRVFHSASQNMLSAKKNPQIIEDYLAKECAAGNILGPFPLNTLAVHINRFGAIPKKHQPGKWRLITDLSYPEGHSINDAINPELCAMSYITVDQVAKTAVSLGKGALIAKIDIKSAYRLVPICGPDRKWLGMQWNDRLYVDGTLPFGLRSAPKIFSSLADAIEWMAVQEGIEFIFHYLDDFAVLGPPDSLECQRALDILSHTYAILGVPLAPEKQDGPCPVIVLLGIIIDTVKQELRLPEEKLRRLLDMLAL